MKKSTRKKQSPEAGTAEEGIKLALEHFPDLVPRRE